jgi:hypothetical protein
MPATEAIRALLAEDAERAKAGLAGQGMPCGRLVFGGDHPVLAAVISSEAGFGGRTNCGKAKPSRLVFLHIQRQQQTFMSNDSNNNTLRPPLSEQWGSPYIFCAVAEPNALRLRRTPRWSSCANNCGPRRRLPDSSRRRSCSWPPRSA